MSVLSSIELVALAKLASVKEIKAARKEVTEGRESVDFTVRIRGEVEIRKDQEIAGTARLLSLATLALVLQHAGVTREAACKALESAFAETARNPGAAKAALLARPEVKLTHDRIKKELVASIPKVKRSGAVKLHGMSVSVIGQELVEADESNRGDDDGAVLTFSI